MVVAAAGWHSAGRLLPPFYLYMVGHGIHQPCGQSGAVGPFPQAAGMASALNGFMMMLAGFAIGPTVAGRWTAACGRWCKAWPCGRALLAAIAWTLVQSAMPAEVAQSADHIPALALAGPTASGKTAAAFAIADALAPRLPVEIISVDSALVYRGMDIGTAKPTPAEQARRAAPPDRHPRPAAGLQRGRVCAGRHAR